MKNIWEKHIKNRGYKDLALELVTLETEIG